MKGKRFYILLFSFVLALIVILSAPVYYGYKKSTTDNKFLGMTALYPTGQFYYMSVGPAQVLRGEYLFADKYERISREQVIINPIGNIIGWIAIGTGLTLPMAFFLYCLFAAIVLVFAFLYLAKQFFADYFLQIIALLIYCFTAGFDFYFHLFNIWIADAVDDSIPEANMFISLSGEYYLPMANALFIAALATSYRIFFKSENRIWLCGLFLFLLGTIYIYGLISAVFILSISALSQGIKEKKIADTLVKLTKLSLFCLPVVGYYIWLIIHFPNIADSGWYPFPSFLAIISTFGFGFLFTLIGFLVKDRKAIAKEFYLLLWIVMTLFLIYLPQPFLPIQIQLLIGLGAPLSILFSSTLNTALARVHAWFPKISGRLFSFFKTGFILCLIVCSSMTNVKFYINQFANIQKKAFPYYLNRDVYKAMEWSAKNISDKKLVIVSRQLGFLFSSITACNVYCGVGSDREVTKESKNIKLIFDDFKNDKPEEAKALVKITKADYLFLDKTLTKGDYEQLRDTIAANFKTCFCNSEVLIVQLNR